jgi:hypothetical protein
MLKRHIRNTLGTFGCIRIFFFGQKGTPKDIGYDVGRCQGHQEVHSGHTGTMVKKFVFKYSFKLKGASRAFEKHNMKDIGGRWKRPKV